MFVDTSPADEIKRAKLARGVRGCSKDGYGAARLALDNTGCWCITVVSYITVRTTMKGSPMRRSLVACCVLLSLGAPSVPVLAQTAPACQYILGFKALHDLDPSDIGSCVDNQAFAANGDAQQHTLNGLMAWRKADNWTAFTNGYQTWINGPTGLVERLNNQRFSWEANPDGLRVVGVNAPIPPAGNSAAPPTDDASWITWLAGKYAVVAGSTFSFTGRIDRTQTAPTGLVFVWLKMDDTGNQHKLWLNLDAAATHDWAKALLQDVKANIPNQGLALHVEGTGFYSGALLSGPEIYRGDYDADRDGWYYVWQYVNALYGPDFGDDITVY